MTFVKAKVKLSQIAAGDQLQILLMDGEPLKNVPRSAEEQGYKILGTEQVKDRIYRVTVQK